MSDDHVLELSAIAPVRPKARIRTDADPDGTLYELAVPEDFGMRRLREMTNKYMEVEEILEGEGKMTVAQEKRVNLLTDQMVKDLIIDVSPEIIAALPVGTKRSLVMRFFLGMGGSFAEILGTQHLTSISENLSPASSGSMAEIPNAGSS